MEMKKHKLSIDIDEATKEREKDKIKVIPSTTRAEPRKVVNF